MSKIPATLIPGDGIGPEIVQATLMVLDALHAPFEWEQPINFTENFVFKIFIITHKIISIIIHINKIPVKNITKSCEPHNQKMPS